MKNKMLFCISFVICIFLSSVVWASNSDTCQISTYSVDVNYTLIHAVMPSGASEYQDQYFKDKKEVQIALNSCSYHGLGYVKFNLGGVSFFTTVSLDQLDRDESVYFAANSEMIVLGDVPRGDVSQMFFSDPILVGGLPKFCLNTFVRGEDQYYQGIACFSNYKLIKNNEE